MPAHALGLDRSRVGAIIEAVLVMAWLGFIFEVFDRAKHGGAKACHHSSFRLAWRLPPRPVVGDGLLELGSAPGPAGTALSLSRGNA